VGKGYSPASTGTFSFVLTHTAGQLWIMGSIIKAEQRGDGLSYLILECQ
jgi:hypothetical protein